MPRRKQSRGKCTFCGREMAKGGLTRHLPSCSARQEAIERANHNATHPLSSLYHLQVQDAWQGNFWLYLDGRELSK